MRINIYNKFLFLIECNLNYCILKCKCTSDFFLNKSVTNTFCCHTRHLVYLQGKRKMFKLVPFQRQLLIPCLNEENSGLCIVTSHCTWLVSILWEIHYWISCWRPNRQSISIQEALGIYYADCSPVHWNNDSGHITYWHASSFIWQLLVAATYIPLHSVCAQ